MSDRDFIDRARREFPCWEVNQEGMERCFSLRSFQGALDFVRAVGHLAEEANHHPDIDIRYRRVKIWLTTHDCGGISEKDLRLAGQIEEIAEKGTNLP